MPAVSRALVRLSLLNLIAGASLGAALLLTKSGLVSPRVWTLLDAHIDLVLGGWLLQFAAGVAWWILPRRPGGRARRPAAALLLGAGLVNAGSVASVAGSLAGAEALAIWARLLLAGAATCFAAGIASRVRMPPTARQSASATPNPRGQIAGHRL